jgi:hypothetical protein
MTVHQLRLFGANGRIVTVQDLSAATDQEALSVVRGIFKGASAVVSFDLSEGERRVQKAALTTKKQSPAGEGSPRHRAAPGAST